MEQLKGLHQLMSRKIAFTLAWRTAIYGENTNFQNDPMIEKKAGKAKHNQRVALNSSNDFSFEYWVGYS